jgi:signal transduction histidine kinase
MRRRIAEHMGERMQILAAVSHDLRTPITRMRVRCELLPDSALRLKLQADLDEMQHLLEEGLALAASDHAANEAAVAVDMHALLDAIVCDYGDAGQAVKWSAQPGLVLITRPLALGRAVNNLLDNAIKFGSQAELRLETRPGQVSLSVLDRGPGIAPERLHEAMQPFSRLEASRHRGSGGTGLGLAIARRLADALGASLVLRPRPGGGLHAELCVAVPSARCGPGRVVPGAGARAETSGRDQ